MELCERSFIQDNRRTIVKVLGVHCQYAAALVLSNLSGHCYLCAVSFRVKMEVGESGVSEEGKGMWVFRLVINNYSLELFLRTFLKNYHGKICQSVKMAIDHSYKISQFVFNGWEEHNCYIH